MPVAAGTGASVAAGQDTEGPVPGLRQYSRPGPHGMGVSLTRQPVLTFLNPQNHSTHITGKEPGSGARSLAQDTWLVKRQDRKDSNQGWQVLILQNGAQWLLTGATEG